MFVENVERNILRRIIKKGGMMGMCAEFYINDEKNAGLFILECSEQCHHQSMTKLWGIKLVSDILEYKKKPKNKQNEGV